MLEKTILLSKGKLWIKSYYALAAAKCYAVDTTFGHCLDVFILRYMMNFHRFGSFSQNISMNLILVPTDLSPASQNATNYAAFLCKELQAKMMLLHVYMLPVPVSELPYVMVSADEIHLASEKALEKEADRIFEMFGSKPECLVRLGLPSDEIRDLEKERNIDLVIIGMKGAGGFDKLIGSTTVAVIRKCHKPVLVIPHQASFTPVKLVSYATDFSYQTNLKCFEPLKALLKRFNAKLLIVNVQKAGKVATTPELAAKQRLEPLFQDIQHSYHIVEDNAIEHGLQRFVEEHSPAMLAMVAHKNNFLERIFGTHHTKAMIYQTHIPLLILQDKD